MSCVYYSYNSFDQLKEALFPELVKQEREQIEKLKRNPEKFQKHLAEKFIDKILGR